MLMVTGRLGSTAFTASRSIFTKSTTWWVTNRFQSSIRVKTPPSPSAAGAWISSQLVTVWLQKAFHHC